MLQAAGESQPNQTSNHCRSFVGRVGRVRLLLLLMLLVLGLWVGFAKLLVPAVIEGAYRGESWAFLNRMISGQTVRSAQYYVQLWDSAALVGLVSSLGFLLMVLVSSSPGFLRKVVGEATPGTLGAIRMWTCTIVLLTTLLEDMGSLALLPAEVRQPRGLLGLLYPLPLGLTWLATSATGLRVLQGVTEVVLFLGVIGWHTRLVLPLGALCHFLQLGLLIDHSFFWHQNLVPLYVLLVLCATPCGDGWSVDRLQKIARGQPVPDAARPVPVYGWARYLCWVVIAIPYVAAGLGKWRDGGWFWWNATNMRTKLYADTLNPREFDWAFSLQLIHIPDFFFSFIGVFTLCSETFFGLVLFSRLARSLFPPAAMAMHTGIFLLQRILFLDLILLQFLFFDWRRLRQAMGRCLARKRGPWHVLYDGTCPRCRRAVRGLTGLDLFARLAFLDIRCLDGDASLPGVLSPLALGELAEGMHVVYRGKVSRGFAGYRRMAGALPALWPLVPWLWLPGLTALGAWGYGSATRRCRMGLWCDAHEAVPSAAAGAAVPGTPASATPRGTGYACVVSGIILLGLLCWFYRVEFYPFTSWHLYSDSVTGGQFEYRKVLAQHESGETSRARLEDTIGAIALDNRYSPFLHKCFRDRPEDVAICQKFLGAAAAAYNQKASPGERIRQYEIQVWTWDFRAYPVDPHHGHLTGRFVFDIHTGRGLRERLPGAEKRPDGVAQ